MHVRMNVMITSSFYICLPFTLTVYYSTKNAQIDDWLTQNKTKFLSLFILLL